MARKITIEVVADTAKAERDAQKLGRTFKSALDPAVGSASSLRSALGGLSTALGAVAGLAVFKQIAQFGIDLDKSRNAMTALTGSIEAANRKLAELRDLAKASPGVTQGFAAEIFQQMKAIGGIADQTINSVIKSLGKLNTIFSDVGPDFARNLVQIFQQGFERSDIKEALGRVPIFEQLLKSAFGSDDPDKLRKLKDAGALSMDQFLIGVSEQIEKRFPQVRDSLASQFAKAKDDIVQALGPLGEDLARILIENKDHLLDLIREFGNLIKQVVRLGQELNALEGLKQLLFLLRGVIADLADVLENPRLLLTFSSGPRVRSMLDNDAAGRAIERLNDPTRGSPFLEGSGAAGTPAGSNSPFLQGPIRSIPQAVRTAITRTGVGGSAAARIRRDRGISFPSLTADELVSSQFEGEAELRARAADIARGRDVRRALTLQLGESEDAAFRRQRLKEGRLTRAALTFDFDQAEKARKALEKTGELLSANERFARGFASSVVTMGDAFERFGSNVARSLGNVRDLFGSLKQTVMQFFNDIIGAGLQNLVRSTLGPIFGSIGGGGAAAGSALGMFGFGQGFGLGGASGISGGLNNVIGGASSVFSGSSKFSLSGLGTSLLNAAPLIGLGIGSQLGGKSLGGNILGAAGGLLTGTFAAASLGSTSGLAGLAPTLFSNPITAVIGAGLLVGSVFLGKAKQRKQDEAASGQLLTSAIEAIRQLKSGIASDSIDGGQAQSIFDSQILSEFIRGINTLKTESVRRSRLTNQVADLRRVYADLIPPEIAAQASRRTAGVAQQQRSAANAAIFSRQIPEFATGGRTSGGLAMLHPGEMVLNMQQQAAVRSMAGARVFDRAGVPGVQKDSRFDQGGIFGGNSAMAPIVIENLTVGYMVGKGDASRAFVLGGSTEQGRMVTVNNIRIAKTNREL